MCAGVPGLVKLPHNASQGALVRDGSKVSCTANSDQGPPASVAMVVPFRSARALATAPIGEAVLRDVVRLPVSTLGLAR